MVFTFSPNVLISHLKAALRFVSSDDSKRFISCVRLEGRGVEARFIATDGFRLWAAIAECKVVDAGAIHISRHDAARLVKTIDKKNGDVALECGGEHIIVRQGVNTMTFKHVDLSKDEKQFPDYAPLLEPMVPDTLPRALITVNGDYFIDASSSFADVCDSAVMKADGSTVRIFPGESVFSAVTMVSPGSRAIAILLPLRAEKYDVAAAEVDELVATLTAPPIPSRRKKVG